MPGEGFASILAVSETQQLPLRFGVQPVEVSPGVWHVGIEFAGYPLACRIALPHDQAQLLADQLPDIIKTTAEEVRQKNSGLVIIKENLK